VVKEERDLRADLTRIAQVALAEVAPETCLRRAVRLEGEYLNVAQQRFDLTQIRRIIVVGMGKASSRMAASLEGILGEKISKGLIVTADGYKVPTRRVEVVEASHPVPDARGLAAAKRIVTLLDEADEDDLVIVLLRG
jgi:hydroxypyruvate reductase